MKQLYFLMLLITGFTFANPIITNPTPLEVCDANNDGAEVFDLTVKIGEVLGSLDPNLYSVTFYETQFDADSSIGGIVNPTAFMNIAVNTQTVYIRVEEVADSTSFSVTPLTLIANPSPVPGNPIDITIDQNPFVGTAIFDLRVNDILLANGMTGVTVTYYPSLADAQINAFQISNPEAYSGTNGQRIGVRVQNDASGCDTLTSFHLYINSLDNVTIPDANFKAKLIALGVDTNGDNEIQFTEALIATNLNVSNANISDLTGIEAFTNLVSLNCGSNNIATLDVGNLINLTTLSVVDNGMTAIQNLNLLVNLNELNLYQNQVSTLNVTSLVNLTSLNTGNNPLTTLNVSQNTALTYLFCPQNMLSAIDISSLVNLKFFYCYANQISSLNLTNNPALIFLYCEENQISSLNVSNLQNLINLDCSSNLITTLSVAGTNLSTLKCAYNPLVSLDVSGLTGVNHLAELFCDGTLLTTLDLSSDHIDQNLMLQCNNTQLSTLFMKNGSLQQSVTLQGNPNLSFICVDDDNELEFFKALVASYGYTNCVVNSYCSFTPGGNYNTINAGFKFDVDNNGCDVNDEGYANIRVNINDGTNSGASFTGVDGTTLFYTQTGNFTLTAGVENPTWYTISPSSVTIPFTNTNSTASQNFCISANGIHPDLEVVILPITPARPGFDADYKIVFKNKGNQTISHANDGISFTYDYNRMNLVETSEPLSLILAPPGTLNWDLLNLVPFESRSISLKMHINAPTHPTYPVNNGDVLPFIAVVNPIIGDETPSDNTFNYYQTVVGSFDPNDIICIEGDVVPPSEIGKYLHYVINFENTGTFQAENIVVKDIIDATQFDVNTIQILDSSAPVKAKLTGNVAEFVFQNINLHSGGHGNILIKLKTKNTLVEGDSVSKKANIYFDYNFPVETLPEDTVFQTLTTPGVEPDKSISVYPNPTKGNVNIQCSNTIKSVQLFDVQGRLLQTNLVNENQANLDISSQSKGVYFIKIISDNGMKVQKIVKE